MHPQPVNIFAEMKMDQSNMLDAVVILAWHQLLSYLAHVLSCIPCTLTKIAGLQAGQEALQASHEGLHDLARTQAVQMSDVQAQLVGVQTEVLTLCS